MGGFGAALLGHNPPELKQLAIELLKADTPAHAQGSNREAAGALARVAAVIAGHLAGLVRRGQADGDIRDDADPEAAAWLLLSVLSTRSLRAAGMPGSADLEPHVAALALGAIAPPAASAGHEG